MARLVGYRDISSTLEAAEHWISSCLIEDGSIFHSEPRWTAPLVDEVYHAFVDHPDTGDGTFMTKLQGQTKAVSLEAKQLAAEMLWALLLFPSNMRARTKRQQVGDIWASSGHPLPESHPYLQDNVVAGVGSGGTGFNTYRPDEMAFLITLVRDLKGRTESERRNIFHTYGSFTRWMSSITQQGQRQFRHMLRYFVFPNKVERIASNSDRQKILDAFGVAPIWKSRLWKDDKFDHEFVELRTKLEADHPSQVLDFYDSPLVEKWSPKRKLKTLSGEVTVTVPGDDEDLDDKVTAGAETKSPDARQSIQVQAKLAEIGATMGFSIWIPRSDRSRIRELISENVGQAFLDDLPLNYDPTTLATIEQIDILWLRRRSIVRAFEVEHTTAVYSGLLRMADLLALQPNMDIRLHIVAPDERREKVFREMTRPVFSFLDRGPLAQSCTFISYESVDAIRSLGHLSHTNDSIIADYEEEAE